MQPTVEEYRRDGRCGTRQLRAANNPGEAGPWLTLDATGTRMRTWLTFAPLIGAALYGNAIKPVSAKEAGDDADFERACAGKLAAAREMRAETIGAALRSRIARRALLCVVMLLGLVLYVLVLRHLQVPLVSPWAMAAVFVAAMVSSVAGFAFSAICGAMLFHLVSDPVDAVQIMMVCSLGGQALMTWSLRREIRWRALAVFGIGAIVGLPIGIYLLLHTPAALFTRILGGLLVLYAGWMILRRPIVLRRQHAAFDVMAGVLGGITGGAAAFPGAAVTIWCGLKGWTKERQRGVYQPFILLVQFASIALLLGAGFVGGEYARGFHFTGIACLPAMFAGCAFGMDFFKWLDDRQFARGVNAMLLVSGVSLLT